MGAGIAELKLVESPVVDLPNSLGSMEGHDLSQEFLESPSARKSIQKFSAELSKTLIENGVAKAQTYLDQIDPLLKNLVINDALKHYMLNPGQIKTDDLDFLHQNGASFSKNCVSGHSIFQLGLSRNVDLETLKHMEKLGADPVPNNYVSRASTLVLAFFYKCSDDVLSYLIESNIPIADDRNKPQTAGVDQWRNTTAFQSALKYGASPKIIRDLIIRPEVLRFQHWDDCLNTAIESKMPLEIIKLVAEKISSLDYIPFSSSTPRFLESAITHHPDPSVLKYIVNRGAHACFFRSKEESFLEYAVALPGTTPEMLDIIVKAKPTWSAYVKEAIELLFRGKNPINVFFIRKLVDVNYVNPDSGCSILETALIKKAPEGVILKLRDLGAKTSHVNGKTGKNIADVARESGYSDSLIKRLV